MASSKTNIVAKRILATTWNEGRDVFYMVVTSELAGFAGQRPYFATTASIRMNGREDRGGCCHEEILKRCPQFGPAIALHLSDEDGVPMHGVENGWYWMAGALGGAGEQYHGGSGSDARTPERCLEIWAEHVRVTIDEARRYRDAFAALRQPIERDVHALMTAEYGPVINEGQAWREEWTTERMARRNIAKAWATAREFHNALLASFAPRWKKEAEAVKKFLAEPNE